jgi:hypothetical protein
MGGTNPYVDALAVSGNSLYVGGNFTTAGSTVSPFIVGAELTTVTVTLPTVTASTANLAANATSIVINGTGFDTQIGNNTVVFNDGAVGTVTAATSTSLTVTFITKPASAGSLTAVVTTDGYTSGSPVQVATAKK